jgi:hypothetical protein
MSSQYAVSSRHHNASYYMLMSSYYLVCRLFDSSCEKNINWMSLYYYMVNVVVALRRDQFFYMYVCRLLFFNFLLWVPCPVVYTYYLTYTQSVGKSKEKKYWFNPSFVKENLCLSSSSEYSISCDVASFFKAKYCTVIIIVTVFKKIQI